jgi:predicted lysophospholipase L1 biosynthesis ABC-type transport system permease subunit
VKLLVGRGALQLMIGLGIGVVIALGFARLLSSELFGVMPWDPVTFAVVIVTIGLVALAAALLPARRALAVDLAETLRYEQGERMRHHDHDGDPTRRAGCPAVRQPGLSEELSHPGRQNAKGVNP